MKNTFLYYNAHQPALAVIDDLLHGVLEFCLAFFADGVQLAADAVLDELLDGFAEDVGLPDALAAVAALTDVLDQVFCLLLGAYDGGNLCLDVRLDHVDGGAFGTDLDAVLVALADDGGVLDPDLGQLRDDHAVASTADSLQGGLDFHVLLFHGGKLFHGVDQVVFAVHGDAAELAEDAVIVFVLHLQADADGAVGKADFIQKGVLDIGSSQFNGFFLDVTDVGEMRHPFFDLGEDLGFQLVVRGKHFYPFWDVELDLADRKFVEDMLQDPGDVLLAELLAVGGHGGNAVGLLEFFCQDEGFFFVRHLGIDQDEEGLALLLQLGDGLFFRFEKVFPGKLAEASVCGNDKTDGGVFLDDLAGAELRRLVERDGAVEPGSFDHALSALLHVPGRVLDQKAHAVDEADADLLVVSQGDGNGFLWYEFGFYGGDEFSCAA